MEIDVQPRIPKADTLPILKLAMDFSHPDFSVLEGAWESNSGKRQEAFDATLGDFWQAEIDADKKRGGITTTALHYPPVDMNRTYAKNNPLTLGDIVQSLQTILSTLGEDADGWAYDSPTEIQCNETRNRKTGEIMLPGTYTLLLYQKLRGIPLLCHARDAVHVDREKERWARTDLMYQTRTLDAISLYWSKMEETAIIADDVPLCEFSAIQRALEAEIQKGHIRKIFDVELGYAMYNEPGASDATDRKNLPQAAFYAVPVWKVNCYYVENGKKELRDYTGLDVPERATIEYSALYIHAQTGQLLDPYDNHKGFSEYQGFLSWADIGDGQP